MAEPQFSHLDEQGKARMVDVGGKDVSHRTATARCQVKMNAETLQAITSGSMPKGDVLAVARVAGIQAAKRTSDAIPMCHPLPLSSARIDFAASEGGLTVEAHVETTDRTGVEMEALHACAVAALTIYDMCKSADRAMTIEDLALWEKTGGRSGTYRREVG
jgi:cyclic pyranopterin phosphate synthase